MTRDEARRQARERLLGDRVAGAFKAVGIDQAVRAVARWTGRDCGCARRTAALNAWDARRR